MLCWSCPIIPYGMFGSDGILPIRSRETVVALSVTPSALFISSLLLVNYNS